MRKQKNCTPASIKFTPTEESSLTSELLLSEEVMKLLCCSSSTLKNLRKKKLLPFSKLGGLIYYNSADVQQLLINARRLSLSLVMSLIMV